MNISKTLLGIALLASFISGPLAAEPLVKSEPCPACHGKRSLSLTPPNLGQFDGEIGVTPGRPFTSHRFDVRYKVCPLCEGKGRHELYALTVKPPPETTLDACSECRWAGVTPCRKCNGAGYQACRKCQTGSYSNKGGKPGWIVTQKPTTAGMKSSSKYAKTLVTPCGTCSGIGRVPCPDCRGRGGVICRKCHGEGGQPKKERK